MPSEAGHSSPVPHYAEKRTRSNILGLSFPPPSPTAQCHAQSHDSGNPESSSFLRKSPIKDSLAFDGSTFLDTPDAEGPFLSSLFAASSEAATPATTHLEPGSSLPTPLPASSNGAGSQPADLLVDVEDDGDDDDGSGWQPGSLGGSGGPASWPTWAEYAPEEEAINTVWAELLSVDEEVKGEGWEEKLCSCFAPPLGPQEGPL